MRVNVRLVLGVVLAGWVAIKLIVVAATDCVLAISIVAQHSK
jgi:hypothetical protein